MSRWTQLAALSILHSLLTLTGSATTSCYNDSSTLDWYTDAVGETPCMTYQRLRQVCNSGYTTPSWVIDGPTDQCDDPLSICCCNSIAWSLRMLCINCQWDEFGTSDQGHSATSYAYYDYRWSSGTAGSGTYCGDGYNQTLPDSLQQSVCNNGLQLSDFLYTIFWPDGSWSFPTYETLAEQILSSHSNATLSLCGNSTDLGTPASNSTSTTTTTSPTAMPAAAKSDTAAIVGGTLGGALALVLLGAIVTVVYIKKRHPRHSRPIVDIAEDRAYHGQSSIKPENAHVNTISPFLGQYGGLPLAEQLSQYTLSPAANSESDPHSYGSYVLPTTVDGLEADESPDSSRNAPRGRSKKTMVDRWQPSARTETSRTEMRERGGDSLSMRDSGLPPDYRTVYSGE